VIFLSVVALAGLIAGSLLLLKISPVEFSESLVNLFRKEKTNIKARVIEASKKKKIRGLKKLITDTREILTVTNRSGKFSFICILAMLLFIVGTLVGIASSNMFLVPTLAGGLSLLPFWYILFTAKNSYLRSESIITAVDENIT